MYSGTENCVNLTQLGPVYSLLFAQVSRRWSASRAESERSVGVGVGCLDLDAADAEGEGDR